MSRPLRIAQVAPPMERVPPRAYGGTERVVFELVKELDRRGHEVTTFASGDSEIPGRHIVTVPEALRPAGYTGDSLPYFNLTMLSVLDRIDEFDIIHSHLEWVSTLLARVVPIPVIATFHGRLDLPWATETLANAPAGLGLVAISQNQASAHPDIEWAGIVHNGLTLDDSPFERRRGEGLCFVGRVAPEKGILEAIEIAKLSGRPLRIAAKVGPLPPERTYYDEVFKPALAAAGSQVEYLGEVEQAERDQLFAESYAALMPGSWPEPFGLVAIEALACGTPVVTRRVGALPEIIREGIDGYFGDDVTEMAFKLDLVGELDRTAISRSVRERFSATRMTDAYEEIYRTALAGGDETEGDEDGLLPASSGAAAGGDTSRSASAQPRPIRPLQASTVR
jgi:glycosyltransferase involved in cell wall biosynthesis